MPYITDETGRPIRADNRFPVSLADGTTVELADGTTVVPSLPDGWTLPVIDESSATLSSTSDTEWNGTGYTHHFEVASPPPDPVSGEYLVLVWIVDGVAHAAWSNSNVVCRVAVQTSPDGTVWADIASATYPRSFAGASGSATRGLALRAPAWCALPNNRVTFSFVDASEASTAPGGASESIDLFVHAVRGAL